ncbi:Zn-ribbon domain-containing protein [Halovivax limisalsi]|uniref:Zn-ribbon domain-containing protein n=1 Tax=Halovivax limisalsi TaxID=1453760 RepID=UPI001FFD230B|nr:Zn-ribbon containing protein [Halovivax limisalsi]
MPHQCTTCDRRFPDGSKEMLSGCPDCGGNKFQFAPANRADSSEDAESSETAGPGSAAEPEASATSDAREWPATARRPAERDVDPTDRADDSAHPAVDSSRRADESASDRDDAMADEFEWVDGDEDTAQASARSDVVSPDELPTRSADVHSTDDPQSRDDRGHSDAAAGDEVEPADPPGSGRVVSEPSPDQPSIEQLREELNDQFESIKIVSPGQYELNLMELYDREEHIVSLQEDGRYVINVPDSWHSDE